MSLPRIGIAATSAVVPKVEFGLGVEKIESEGFDVSVHPFVKKRHGYLAGSDEERADSFFELARDPSREVLWCARGGYGATRILSRLDELARKHGKPQKKLLVGYSDATALHAYVARRWNWWTLHAPMPGMREFCVIDRAEWRALSSWVARKQAPKLPWGKLKFVRGLEPRGAIMAELIGGNLSVWTALLGTPYAMRARGKILFLEDVDERPYRIDRMIQQLVDSGGLDGVKAVVLGNWLNCADAVGKVLRVRPSVGDLERMIRQPRPEELMPLRPKLPDRVVLDIISDACRRARVPLAYGLPAGHGPGHAPVPLGATYRLGADGRFTLERWSWLGRSK